MKVFGYERIERFLRKHADAKPSLLRWYSLTLGAIWRSFTDVREAFPTADKVGTCVVFNIAWNKYRLIAKVDYELQTVDIRYIITHKQYDKAGWKKDCK
jgi:mRNA interferase HigB